MTADASVPSVPDLALAQLRYSLTHSPDASARASALAALLAAVKASDAAPLYELVCADAKQAVDGALLAQMRRNNDAKMAELDKKLKDAEESAGETEISDALIAKAEYLAMIGEKENALNAFRVAFEKTPGVGAKIDLVFSQLRIGMFFADKAIISAQLAKAKSLIEQGGDWDRRNRCKVYEATFLMTQRDFTAAAALLIETLATFTSTELFSMHDYISYTVLMGVFALPRPEIKSKLMEAPEVLEVVDQVPHLRTFMSSLYECNYALFFQSLAHMETRLLANMYLAPHAHFFVREMRIRAYNQLLESYRSLTLPSMAQAFGVTPAFIDMDLYRFIVAGRVHAVMDKVKGVIETNRPDAKNAQYQQVVKQGDALLNRVQKLGRVINV